MFCPEAEEIRFGRQFAVADILETGVLTLNLKKPKHSALWPWREPYDGQPSRCGLHDPASASMVPHWDFERDIQSGIKEARAAMVASAASLVT